MVSHARGVLTLPSFLTLSSARVYVVLTAMLVAWTPTAASGCTERQASVGADAAPAAMLVEYQRSGGFVGFDDQVTVHRHGAVEVRTRAGQRTATVPAATLERLSTALAAVPQSAWTGEATAVACCDQIEHVVRAAGKVARFGDDAVPEAFRPLIAIFADILTGR